MSIARKIAGANEPSRVPHYLDRRLPDRLERPCTAPSPALRG